jgi:hypothetical protein
MNRFFHAFQKEAVLASGISDMPGRSGGRFGSANYNDAQVNGRHDLLDFFPLWVNARELVEAPPSPTASAQNTTPPRPG